MVCSLHFGKNWAYWVRKNLDSEVAIGQLFAILRMVDYNKPRIRVLYALQKFEKNEVEKHITKDLDPDLTVVLQEYVLTGRVVEFVNFQKGRIPQKANTILKELKNLWGEYAPGAGLFSMVTNCVQCGRISKELFTCGDCGVSGICVESCYNTEKKCCIKCSRRL